jgi:hypothetical protein
MGNLSGAVGHLKKELVRAQQEVQRFTAALAALGSSGSSGRQTMTCVSPASNTGKHECYERVALSCASGRAEARARGAGAARLSSRLW